MIDKNLLIKLYWQDKLSLRDIGKKFNRDDETIRYYFKKYFIPIRNKSESLSIGWKKRERHYNILPCDCCGKTVTVYESEEIYDNHFCSRKCKLKFHSENISPWNKGINIVEITCDFCSKQILRPLSKLKQSKSHFCSKECYDKWKIKNLIGNKNPNWKNGSIRYRGDNWNVQRKKILELDNYECVFCGSTEKLDVHHIVPFRNFLDYNEANQLENLITLCHSCHMIYENEGIILIREWQKNNGGKRK